MIRKQLFPGNFRNLSDWMALGMAILLIAGFIDLWFVPSATTCSSVASSATSCHSTSLAGSMGLASVIISPLLTLFTMLLAGLLLYFRRHRVLLGGFGFFILAFFVASFGLGLSLLPAALLSVVVALMPPYGTR